MAAQTPTDTSTTTAEHPGSAEGGEQADALVPPAPAAEATATDPANILWDEQAAAAEALGIPLPVRGDLAAVTAAARGCFCKNSKCMKGERCRFPNRAEPHSQPEHAQVACLSPQSAASTV